MFRYSKNIKIIILSITAVVIISSLLLFAFNNNKEAITCSQETTEYILGVEAV